MKFDDGDSDDFELEDLTAVEVEDDTENDIVGKTMGFKKGKKMLVGKILSVDEDDGTFEMKTDAGKTVTGDVSDLEEPEEDEPETEDDVELEKGSRVSATIDGDDYEGEITKIKGSLATVKFDDGDSDDFELEDLTALEAEDDSTEFEIGDAVVVDYKGKDTNGKIKAIDEDENEAKVMLTKLKKKITVSLDDIVAA